MMKTRELDLSRVTCNKNKSWGKAAPQMCSFATQ